MISDGKLDRAWKHTIPRPLNCFQKQRVGEYRVGQGLFLETPAETRVGVYKVRYCFWIEGVVHVSQVIQDCGVPPARYSQSRR